MKKFAITCRNCGAKASIRESEQYDNEENYAGSTFTVYCQCGAEEEVEATS